MSKINYIFDIVYSFIIIEFEHNIAKLSISSEIKEIKFKIFNGLLTLQ